MIVAFVITYVLFLVSLVIYKTRSVKTKDDFVVAGRSTSLFVLISTLVCTWIGSGSLFGSAGLTFREGISELWFSAGAWIGIVVVYFVAGKVRKISSFTLTDIFDKRYGSVARLLATITIIVAYLAIAGYQFKGGGRVISILTEGAVSPFWGTFITCCLVVLFTASAGMISIVTVDVFNGLVMLVAIFAALWYTTSDLGGTGAAIDQVRQINSSHLSLFDGHDTIWILGIMLPTFILLLSESSMYQKFSSAKSSAMAKKAVIGMLIGVIVIEVMMCLLSLNGFAIYGNDARFYDGGEVIRSKAEEIILLIAYEQLPQVLGATLFAAAAAIILSTGNTFLMVTSTNFNQDILQKYFGKTLGNVDSNKLQRMLIVFLGFLAFVMVIQFESILELSLIAYTMIGASLSPALLAVFFWKRVTARGGVASIIAGMASVLVISMFNAIFEQGGFGIFPIDTDYIAIPALFCSVVTLVVVSLSTEKTDKKILDQFID